MLAQIELITKLAENGIIAAAFLYILYWLLNKQSAEIETQFRNARLTNMEVARAIRSLVSAVMAIQQQLLVQDLTVSGLNPSSGASFEERDSMALKRYNEIAKTLDEQRTLIRELNLQSDRRMAELQE